MQYVVLGIIAVIIFWRLIQRAGKAVALVAGGTGDFYSLLRNGIPARGILLKVGSQRNARGTASPGYYELRSVTIDIEVPGKEPYEVDCMIAVPANLCRLILPGATLELRIDASHRGNVAVFGPGVGLTSAGYQ